MKSDILTKEDCIQVLVNRFLRKDIEFLRYEIKGISDNVEGFLGEHYYLHITYKLDNETNTEIFFLKSKPDSSEFQNNLCEQFSAYKKEIFIYNILIKEFEKYGYDTSFTSKCYLCVPGKALVFENLVNKGFTLSEKPFDLHKIKSILKSLALFHAAGLAYQEAKNKELGSFAFEKEFSDYLRETFILFYFNPGPDSILMSWWNMNFRTMSKVIDLLPESENYKTQFKEMFSSYPFGKIYVEESKFAKTCSHGDLWCNNMLFKNEDDKIVDTRLVDFQLIRYFYPSNDVVLLIYFNTDSEMRKNHLNDLYEHYYTELSDNLIRYGCFPHKIMSREDFYESIRITKPDALLHVLCTSCLVYLPKTTLIESVKENNAQGLEEIMKDNMKVTCDAFRNDERYHRIISESLQDLQAALIDVK